MATVQKPVEKAAVSNRQESVEKAAKRPSAKQFRFGYLVHDVSRIRRTVMDQVMPGGVPAILDVRRGKLLVPSRRRSDKRLDADVAGVVAHWAAIWRAIA